MRKEEREHCAQILAQNVDLGVHDATRLLNYCDALEVAAVKMWKAYVTQDGPNLMVADVAEIKECMKVALPPGEV